MNIIIVGGGKTGSYLASQLGERGEEVKVIESRKLVAERLEARLPKGTVVRGIGSSPDVLEVAGVLRADIVIAVTGDDEVNLVVSMLAKMEYNVGRVIARVNNPANAWMFDASMGVDVAIDQTALITRSVEGGIDIEDVLTILRLGEDGHSIVQGEVHPRASVVGKTISEAQVPDGLVFVAIERGGETIVPNGGTELRAGDRVVAFTDDEGRGFLGRILK